MKKRVAIALGVIVLVVLALFPVSLVAIPELTPQAYLETIPYIEIGRLLNLPIMGINLPNHFIVGYLDSKKGNLNPKNYEFNKEDVSFYINPFSQGVILKHHDIQDFIREINVINNNYYLTPCPYADITKRMLTNLNFSYRKSEEIQIKNDLKKIMSLYT